MDCRIGKCNCIKNQRGERISYIPQKINKPCPHCNNPISERYRRCNYIGCDIILCSLTCVMQHEKIHEEKRNNNEKCCIIC